MELLPAACRAALRAGLVRWETAAVQRLLLESRGAAAEGVERHHGGGGGGGRDSSGAAAAREVSGSPVAAALGSGGRSPRAFLWAGRDRAERQLPRVRGTGTGWRPEKGSGAAHLLRRGSGARQAHGAGVPPGECGGESGLSRGGERGRGGASAGVRSEKLRRWARCAGPPSPGCRPRGAEQPGPPGKVRALRRRGAGAAVVQ